LIKVYKICMETSTRIIDYRLEGYMSDQKCKINVSGRSVCSSFRLTKANSFVGFTYNYSVVGNCRN